MTISAAYATPAQYRAVTGKTDAGQDTDILTDLTAVSRYIDGKLRRFFNKDAAAVSRVYIPAESTLAIWVDDLAMEPTAVKLDTGGDGLFATTLATTDYELLPLNANRGPEPRPYTRIGMTSWGKYSSFSAGERVEVTAQFGWPAVPEAIQRATIHLTAILRLESPRATRRIAELGDVMETSQDAQFIVKQLIDQYKVWRV